MYIAFTISTMQTTQLLIYTILVAQPIACLQFVTSVYYVTGIIKERWTKTARGREICRRDTITLTHRERQGGREVRGEEMLL